MVFDYRGGGAKPKPYSDLEKYFKLEIELLVVMIFEEMVVWACLHSHLLM